VTKSEEVRVPAWSAQITRVHKYHKSLSIAESEDFHFLAIVLYGVGNNG
jgi:hypothetical protein